MSRRLDEPICRARIIFLVAIMSRFAVGCPLTVPLAASDQPPVMNVQTFVRDDSGLTNLGARQQDATFYIDRGKKVRIWVSAQNLKGGVSSLSLSVLGTGKVLFDLEKTSTPDANGTVDDTAIIFGTDGAGNLGTIPIEFDPPATAIASAFNFNNMAGGITVQYAECTIWPGATDACVTECCTRDLTGSGQPLTCERRRC